MRIWHAAISDHPKKDQYPSNFMYKPIFVINILVYWWTCFIVMVRSAGFRRENQRDFGVSVIVCRRRYHCSPASGLFFAISRYYLLNWTLFCNKSFILIFCEFTIIKRWICCTISINLKFSSFVSLLNFDIFKNRIELDPIDYETFDNRA